MLKVAGVALVEPLPLSADAGRNVDPTNSTLVSARIVSSNVVVMLVVFLGIFIEKAERIVQPITNVSRRENF